MFISKHHDVGFLGNKKTFKQLIYVLKVRISPQALMKALQMPLQAGGMLRAVSHFNKDLGLFTCQKQEILDLRHWVTFPTTFHNLIVKRLRQLFQNAHLRYAKS